jgi:hypothetical protein
VARTRTPSSVPITLSCSMRNTLPFPVRARFDCRGHAVTALRRTREYRGRAASSCDAPAGRARTRRSFAKSEPVVQTIAAPRRSPRPRVGTLATHWKLRAWRPITTPPQDRRRQRVDRGSEGARSRQDVGAVDVEDADNPSGFELPGADLSDLELDVVVLPRRKTSSPASSASS